MVSRYRIALILVCLCSTVVADDQNVPLAPATADSPPKRIELTDDQIARGQAIRELLALGIDYAREHGQWPKQLSELQTTASPAVTYLGSPDRFKDLERHVRDQLEGVLPVCHESLETHHDGVWIGYADGHIELVRDTPALRLALAQAEPARAALEKIGPRSASVADPIAKPDAKLTVKLLDDMGRPIAGAQVGNCLINADYDNPRGRSDLSTLADKVSSQATISDAEGRVVIQYQWFFYDNGPSDSTAPLIAYQKDRGLIAIVTLKPEAFRLGIDARMPTMEIKLGPGVRVNGSLSRLGAPPAANESILDQRESLHAFPRPTADDDVDVEAAGIRFLTAAWRLFDRCLWRWCL